MNTDGNVVLFEPRLKAKRRKELLGIELKKKIDAAGWNLADPEGSPGSEVCVYLLDSESGVALAFGNSVADVTSSPDGEWHDLVNAWDVVADPDLPCDMEHLNVTAELARRAINSSRLLPDVSLVRDGQRMHLILVLDRDDLDGPCAVIPAISNAPILDATSVRAILNRWVAE